MELISCIMEKIEKARYQGYLWYSDKTAPEVYDDAILEMELDPQVNPFIIEGYLYDAEHACSISIRYVDGEYIVNRYSVSFDAGVIKEYVSNRMDGKILLFKEKWEGVPDPYCENFEVLQPTELVFVGFKNVESCQ